MALVMLWSAVPIFSLPVCAEDVAQAAATEADLRAAVESQIRAFAKSINQSNADDAAAKALAKHGLSGGGKKLSVGKTHSLTATLWNSEMMQTLLIDICAESIDYMKRTALPSLQYVRGGCEWGNVGSRYSASIYTASEKTYVTIDTRLSQARPYTGKRNSYDQSLDWIVGNVVVDMIFAQKKTTAEAVTYEVILIVTDRFDFHTSSNSGFKKLISGLGELFFREFDWESRVTFEIVVPNSCPHRPEMYRLIYDAETGIMESDNSDGYTENNVTRYLYQKNEEKNLIYYGLEKTIRLYHHQPWVLEYDIQKPGTFVLTPTKYTSSKQFCFYQNANKYLFARDFEYVELSEKELEQYGTISVNQQFRHYYGTALKDLFTYSISKPYTFRLENVIMADGSNMIYLTISRKDTGEVVLESIPMDDYYVYVNSTTGMAFHGESNLWVSGKDFYIGYIGNTEYGFSADLFELRVWENGVDNADGTYCTSKVTKPTCTKGGYTTYTCTLCGYSFTGDKTSAKGHTYKTQVTAPTCTEKGFTTHTCSCGESYVDSYVEALSHSYKNGLCSVCGEKNPVFFGDLDEDGVITTTDIVLLRRYIAGGYGVALNPSAADLNMDGVLTSTDVVILRRYIAGGYGITLPNSAA